jgi:hypothetical protein
MEPLNDTVKTPTSPRQTRRRTAAETSKSPPREGLSHMTHIPHFTSSAFPLRQTEPEPTCLEVSAIVTNLQCSGGSIPTPAAPPSRLFPMRKFHPSSLAPISQLSNPRVGKYRYLCSTHKIAWKRCTSTHFLLGREI